MYCGLISYPKHVSLQGMLWPSKSISFDNHVGPDTYSPFVWFLVAYLDYRLLLVGGTDLMPWSVHRP